VKDSLNLVNFKKISLSLKVKKVGSLGSEGKRKIGKKKVSQSRVKKAKARFKKFRKIIGENL